MIAKDTIILTKLIHHIYKNFSDERFWSYHFLKLRFPILMAIF
jgi:hypothetical protein